MGLARRCAGDCPQHRFAIPSSTAVPCDGAGMDGLAQPSLVVWGEVKISS